MRARYIKIIIWVVALIVIWSLGQTYTVTNSLFVFAAAGVIPGTNIALNPNQVLVLLASMLAASIFLIFGTNIYRGVRKLVTASASVVPTELPVKKKAKASRPQPVVIIKPPKQPGKAVLLLHIANTFVGLLLRSVGKAARKHFPRISAVLFRAGSSVKGAVRRELQLLNLALSVCVVAVFRTVHATVRFLLNAARKVVAFAVAAVRWTIVGVIVAGIQIAHFAARLAVSFWQWLEPRLRTFDAWLGVHYNSGVAAGRARVKQSNSYRTGRRSWRRTLRLLADMRDDLRAALIRSPEE